jgi:hypothetical protein
MCLRKRYCIPTSWALVAVNAIVAVSRIVRCSGDSADVLFFSEPQFDMFHYSSQANMFADKFANLKYLHDDLF